MLGFPKNNVGKIADFGLRFSFKMAEYSFWYLRFIYLFL